MKARHFLTLQDLGRGEIEAVLRRAREMKKDRAKVRPCLGGGAWGLLFFKNSTRTRVSFEVGIRKLGGSSLFLDSSTLQAGRGESLADTGRILSGYLDGLIVRTFGQEHLEELASQASIPVVNALTDQWHPAQVLADLMTAQEVLGDLGETRWCYLGDGNNMARTLAVGASLMGFEIRLAGPRGYWVQDDLLRLAQRLNPKARMTRTEDARAAVKGAQVLYTDTWISMGDNPAESEARELAFRDYQLNDALLDAASPEAFALHCLPAHRGQEITDRVMDGPRSRIWQQAENRLWAQMALLEFLAAGSKTHPPRSIGRRSRRLDVTAKEERGGAGKSPRKKPKALRKGGKKK
jgi:ornithine carbamoyltransferase